MLCLCIFMCILFCFLWSLIKCINVSFFLFFFGKKFIDFICFSLLFHKVGQFCCKWMSLDWVQVRCKRALCLYTNHDGDDDDDDDDDAWASSTSSPPSGRTRTYTCTDSSLSMDVEEMDLMSITPTASAVRQQLHSSSTCSIILNI